MKSLGFQLLILCLFLQLPHQVSAQRGPLKKASKLVALQNYGDAEYLYHSILDKDEDNLSATKGLAEIYKLQGDPAKAEHWYSKALRLEPGNTDLIWELACCHMQNKDYRAALRGFEKYKDQHPFSPQVDLFLRSCEQILSDAAPDSDFELIKLRMNSKQDELSPSFHRDGLVFISGDPSQNSNRQSRQRTYFAKSKNDLQLYEPAEYFEKPTRLEPSSSLCFSPDGSRIYFSDTYLDRKRGAVDKIFMMERDARGDWSGAQEFHFNSNDASYSVADPFISKDGKRLYFSSNMPGGYGGYDLYVTQWLEHSWSAPMNLGKQINSAGDEVKPFEHADGEMIFASDGMGGFGGLDLFAASKAGNQWLVRNLGSPINDSTDDLGLVMSEDKSFGFLSSNRKGGAGKYDIYLVKELLKKEDSFASRGMRGSIGTYDREHIGSGGYDSTNFGAAKATGASVKVRTSGGSGISHPNVGPEESLDIMLVVLVSDRNTNEPLFDAVVELRDLGTNEIQFLPTSRDGQVYFRLEPDRQYTISKILNTSIEDSRLISTINRIESEIINLTLVGRDVPRVDDPGHIPYVLSVQDGSRYQNDESGFTETDTFITDPWNSAGPGKGGEYVPRPTRSKEDQFNLRIQIGVFSRELPASSNFLSQVRNIYEIELGEEGLYHYMVGDFTHLESAKRYCEDMVRLGFKNAIVVPFLNDARLPLKPESAYSMFGE